MSQNRNSMETESFFSDICKHIDSKLDEAKQSAAKSISTIISQIAAYLIIAVLAIITICFLVVVEMQCLNKCLGQPFGTLIAIGTLVLIIVIFFLLRKHLFAGILNKGIDEALGLNSKPEGNKPCFPGKTLAAAAFTISILRKLCK